ncbi:hypothetical protein TNCV_4211021 [Trichonephila clavipes]|nr:hypothetical protein TNCV_4211021 [Trichonephila clavipes]
MIESTINSDEFRSKDGTVVRIPDADFNIVPRSVTKNTTACSTRSDSQTVERDTLGEGGRDNLSGERKHMKKS